MSRQIHIGYTPGAKPVTIDLEVSVSQPGGKVTALFQELVAHHKRNGLDDANAKDAAYQELEVLYRTGHGHFREHYVRLKGSKLDVAFLVEQQALRFYDEAMRNPPPVDVAKLRVILQRTSSLLDELGIPARKMVDDVAPLDTGVKPLPAPAMPPKAPPIVEARVRYESARGRPEWKKRRDADGAEVIEKMLSDGPVTIRTKDSKYPEVEGPVLEATRTKGGTTSKVEEYDVEAVSYSSLDTMSPLLNAHHFCQGALMKRLFGDLYDYDKQPTIWLRNGTGGSPHNTLSSHMQPAFKAVHDKPGSGLTYGMIRDQAVLELTTVRTPEGQIREAIRLQDAIVFEMIKHLPEAEQRKLLGVMEKHH